MALRERHTCGEWREGKVPLKRSKQMLKVKSLLSPGKFRKRKRILDMTKTKQEQDDHDPSTYIYIYVQYIHTVNQNDSYKRSSTEMLG